MPLQKQNISISFAQGLDTKTDPRQVVPGKLEALSNSKFITGMELTKRNGYSLLTTTTTGVGNSVASFEDELLSWDKYSLYSYASEIPGEITTGSSQPIDVLSNYIFAPSGTLQNVYSVRHSSGYILYVYLYVDSSAANTIGYAIVSESTGMIINQNPAVFGGTANGFNHLRAAVIGNFFLIVLDTTSNLQYASLSVNSSIATNTFSGLTTIGTTDATSLSYFQIVSTNSVLNFVWNSPSGGNDRIAVRSLNSSLSLGTASFFSPSNNGIKAIGAWADNQLNPTQIWISYFISSHNSKYLVINSSTYATVLAETNIGTGDHVTLISGNQAGNGHNSVIYFSFDGNSSDTALGDYIKEVHVTDGGSVGTLRDLQHQIRIASDVFQINSTDTYHYFVGTYGISTGTNLQNTYFLFRYNVGTAFPNNTRHTPVPIAKLAAGNALAYIKYSSAASTTMQIDTFQIVSVSQTKVKFSVPKASQVTTNSGTISSSFAVNEYVIDFANNDSYQLQEIGNNLQITGGFLSSYDGFLPAENNFHLFPENLSATTTTMSGSMAAAIYSYIVIFQNTDARGNIHRSAPSVAFSKDISGSGTSTNTITVECTSCCVTQKNGTDLNFETNTLNNRTVYAVFYRNTPTGPGGNATDIYYKVGQTLTDPTADVVQFQDTFADASIIGNEILYTTGGSVENSGGPPCNAITTFKSRQVVCDAENRNTLWYSKQIIPNTPVEMSASFTIAVDPRFGNVTALSVMDDKLIIFKKNAIFYITGNGPDNTGANNDFSDATFISSNAGCVDPRSIVSMQEGLMFKSNKGIYLLDRGLGVSYIGAPVESYNASHVTGGQLIPKSTQVQFTLDDGATCLMYDYFYKQWSTFANCNASAATVYGDLFTYIDPSGHIFQEAVGTYSDNGTAIYQSLTTSWLSLAGLQGFQRVYRLFFLYKYLSAHSVRVDVSYDFDESVAQSITLDATSLAVTNGTVGQWMINLDKQKCQSIKISITEIADSNSTIGAGLNIEAIGVLVGSKLSYPKLPAAQEVTS